MSQAGWQSHQISSQVWASLAFRGAQFSVKNAPYSSSFMRAKSYRGYTSLARPKKNSSKAFMARTRIGSMTRPMAMLTKNRSALATVTSSKWFGNIRVQ